MLSMTLMISFVLFKHLTLMVIVKNSSPPPTVGRQITNSLPTGHRQVTNRLPTVGKNTQEKKYSTETYVKTNKTYQKRRTKSEKLTKSEEQLIVNPGVWINMGKNRVLKIKLSETDVWSAGVGRLSADSFFHSFSDSRWR